MQGFVTVQHGTRTNKRNNAKSETGKIWMECYFQLIGDKMPHNGQIHFPSWEIKKDVCQHYCSDMSQQQLVIISQT